MKPFEETLAKVSSEWVGAGLITAPQREAILAAHPVPAAGSSANRFLGILAAIGGALFVVGVSLVIKSHWERIGDWVKIGGLVALLLGTHALGWRLKLLPGNYPKLGDACLMVGAVLFLLGIALVSQVFHIDSRPANGVLLWWAGIAAVPWLARAKGAQFVSVVAGLTWLGMEFASHDSWLRLARGTARGYDDSFVLIAAVGFLVGTTLAYFGTALRCGRHPDFAGLHEKWGLSLMGWALYALGFTWSAHNVLSYHAMHAVRWQPVGLLTAFALAAAAWALARNRTGAKQLAWLVLAGIVPVAARLIDIELGDSGWLWGGLACVAMFLLDVGMIRVGLAAAPKYPGPGSL